MNPSKNILDAASLAKWSIDIFDSLNEGVLIADTDGIVQYINKQYLRIIGRKEDEILFRKLTEVRPGAMLPSVIKTGQAMNGAYRTDGTVEYVVDMSPIVVAGEIIGGVSIIRDITEAKKMSEELGKTKNTLLDLQGTVKGILSAKYTFDDLIYCSESFRSCVALAERAALSDANIVLQGESGSGKELLAQGIHNASARKHRPFVAINCAAVPAGLLESELFGHTEGAFTGSKKGGKPGLLQLADGGTLFLDEIGDMGNDLQAKLLRVLQEKMVRRVGGFAEQRIDIRVICATHQDLELMVEKNTFRQDLYYRVNVFQINLPPLRKRKEDIPLLAKHFAESHRNPKKAPIVISHEVAKIFQEYDWPGNVRELKNSIEFCCTMSSGKEILPEHLPRRVLAQANAALQFINGGTLSERVREFERQNILQLLKVYGESTEGKRRVAEILGISIAGLYRRLQRPSQN